MFRQTLNRDRFFRGSDIPSAIRDWAHARTEVCSLIFRQTAQLSCVRSYFGNVPRACPQSTSSSSLFSALVRVCVCLVTDDVRLSDVHREKSANRELLEKNLEVNFLWTVQALHVQFDPNGGWSPVFRLGSTNVPMLRLDVLPTVVRSNESKNFEFFIVFFFVAKLNLPPSDLRSYRISNATSQPLCARVVRACASVHAKINIQGEMLPPRNSGTTVSLIEESTSSSPSSKLS